MNDYQKAQLVWNYIVSLDFNCEYSMEMIDTNSGPGYEIIIECGLEDDEEEDEVIED
jgi:hypothetical protein